MVPPALLGLLLLAAAQTIDPETARLEEAVRQSPSSAVAWKALGLRMAAGGSLDAALAPLAKACELAPQDEDACYFLGRTLYTLGRYEEAREPFEKALRAVEKALRARPKESPARVHRAAALNLVGLGRAEEAQRHFREAIRLHRPGVAAGEDPRVDYGAFLARQGRAEEALPPLEQAVRAAPKSARANIALGRVLLEMGKPAAAAARLEKGLGLDGASWNARLLLGKAYMQLGRTEEGERQMRLGQDGWARQNYGSSTVK